MKTPDVHESTEYLADFGCVKGYPKGSSTIPLLVFPFLFSFVFFYISKNKHSKQKETNHKYSNHSKTSNTL